jgi:hypothetical protein
MEINADAINTLLLKVRKLPALKYLSLAILEQSKLDRSSFEELCKEQPRDTRKFLNLRYEGHLGKGLHIILTFKILSIFYHEILCKTSYAIRPEEMERMLG